MLERGQTNCSFGRVSNAHTKVSEFLESGSLKWLHHVVAYHITGRAPFDRNITFSNTIGDEEVVECGCEGNNPKRKRHRGERGTATLTIAKEKGVAISLLNPSSKYVEPKNSIG